MWSINIPIKIPKGYNQAFIASLFAGVCAGIIVALREDISKAFHGSFISYLLIIFPLGLFVLFVYFLGAFTASAKPAREKK